MISSQNPALVSSNYSLYSFVIMSRLIFACAAQHDISSHLLCTTNSYRYIFDEGYMHPVDEFVPADMPVSLSGELSWDTCYVEELHNLPI